MSTTLRRMKGRDAAVAAAWVAAGAIGATVLTGIAFAAGDSTTPPSTAPSTSAPSTDAPNGPGTDDRRGPAMGMGPGGRGDGPGHGGGPGFGPGLGRVQHGDLTVTNKDGNAELVRVQNGEVTAISSTSVTVKSDDGYTSTWTINDDTKIRRDRDEATAADVKVGDTVRIGGPVSGDTATARHIGALSPEAAAEQEKVQAEREAQREQRQQNNDSDSSTQSSNSSSSASLAEYAI